jgi:hypothetical protein
MLGSIPLLALTDNTLYLAMEQQPQVVQAPEQVSPFLIMTLFSERLHQILVFWTFLILPLRPKIKPHECCMVRLDLRTQTEQFFFNLVLGLIPQQLLP